jgi:23S rRNA (guanine745-N1)-methyltransferase
LLRDVVAYLQCPVCRAGMALAGRTLRCERGHSFDVARQGYVNLMSDARTPRDSAEMVAAREAFLGGGHFAPLAEAVAERVEAVAGPGPVMDAGAGTGYFLRTALERLPGRAGLALDSSKHALRRAARAHERIGAVACDLWRPLPVRSGVAAAILNVFAPRNGAEFRRVLREDGALLVVTPAARHLAGLVEPLGLLSVDERKEERLAGALGESFRLEAREERQIGLRLARTEVEALVGMGPSARHLHPAELRRRVAALPEPAPVTAAFRVSTYRALSARAAAASPTGRYAR